MLIYRKKLHFVECDLKENFLWKPSVLDTMKFPLLDMQIVFYISQLFLSLEIKLFVLVCVVFIYKCTTNLK